MKMAARFTLFVLLMGSVCLANHRQEVVTRITVLSEHLSLLKKETAAFDTAVDQFASDAAGSTTFIRGYCRFLRGISLFNATLDAHTLQVGNALDSLKELRDGTGGIPISSLKKLIEILEQEKSLRAEVNASLLRAKDIYDTHNGHFQKEVSESFTRSVESSEKVIDRIDSELVPLLEEMIELGAARAKPEADTRSGLN